MDKSTANTQIHRENLGNQLATNLTPIKVSRPIVAVSRRIGDHKTPYMNNTRPRRTRIRRCFEPFACCALNTRDEMPYLVYRRSGYPNNTYPADGQEVEPNLAKVEVVKW
jgi:hypothetical protein